MFTTLDRQKAYEMAQVRERAMRPAGGVGVPEDVARSGLINPTEGTAGGTSHGKGDLEHWTSHGKGDLEDTYRASPGKGDLMVSRPANATSGSQSATGGTFMNPETMESLAWLNRTDRSLVETGGELGKRFGMGTPLGILGASEIGRSTYGEAGGTGNRRDLEAVVQAILNRLGVAASGKKGFGSTFGRVLSAYDANAYGYKYGRGPELAKTRLVGGATAHISTRSSEQATMMRR